MMDRRQLRCRDCGSVEFCSAEQMLERLRAAGKLLREKSPSPALVLELFVTTAPGLVCWHCSSVGLIVEPWQDDFDDDPSSGRTCSACGQSISVERLEVFPETKLCVACQADDEAVPAGAAEPEYCPRCGALMVLKQRSGSGLTGYVMKCVECQR